MTVNDIQLIQQRGDGNKYDWNFIAGDVANVTGIPRLVSAVKHAILLEEGELVQSPYEDKGIPLVVLQNTSRLGQDFVRQTIEGECREVEGIQDANVTITKLGLNTRITVQITDDEGNEVQI
jgi:hypothetical protein